MKKFLIGAALTVFAMTGANAAIITTTWTGTVTKGSDALNYFGGGSMIGKAFTAIYVFDDAFGTTVIGSGNEHSLQSAAVSASLTINGLTFSYSPPSFYSELYADQDSSFSTTSSIAKNINADTYLSNSVYDLFSAPYADESFADYSGNVANALGNTGVFSWASGPNNRLTLKNTTYSISTKGVAPAVPEPATWAMMIGGFGGIGGAMRARRRKVSVTFA